MLRTFPVAPEAEEEQESEEEAAEGLFGGLGGDRLPPGLGGATPVGRRAERAAGLVSTVTHEALRLALRPLVPLLQEVHNTVASVPDRPDEVSVDFGVRFGSDLKLGIVGNKAEANLNVSATWRLTDGGGGAGAASQPHRPAGAE